MKRKALLLVAASVLSFSLFATPATADFRIMAESFPPFSFIADGKVQGISVELLQEAFKRMGRGAEAESIEILPWARGYNVVMEKPDTVLFSMARTASREEEFKWAGPIYKVQIGALALKSRKITAAKASDLNRYVVGVVKDGAPEELIIKAGIAPDALDRSGDSRSNIKKLFNARIDLFAYPVPVARYLTRQEGLDPEAFENVLTLKEVNLYFAFNKNTDDVFIGKFQAAIDSLDTPGVDGKSFKETIVERYIGPAK